MKISLQDVGRRFNREWIFRGVNYTFEQGKSYAILGINGSGKSTLLQVISGSLGTSKGKISYHHHDKEILVEDVFSHLSIAAPYLELIEEFTLTEMLDFHFQFKPRIRNLNTAEMIELLKMERSKNKQLRYFSSGMKQRLKLILAFCSDTSILLLDEPTSNLDEQGMEWYQSLVSDFSKNRLTIVCSNQKNEYQFCKEIISIENYKS